MMKHLSTILLLWPCICCAQQVRPVSLGWTDAACQLALTYDDGAVKDYSPLQLSVTNFGPGVSFVAGHVNFSGNGTRCQNIVSAPALTNSYTIAAWVRWNGSAAYGGIVVDTTENYGLYSKGSHYDYYSGKDYNSMASIVPGAWTFVAVLVTNWSGTSAVQFWINGSKDKFNTNVQKASWIPGFLGSDTGSDTWIGDIDDVFIFSRALSDVEIPRLYEATRNDPR
jgi:Concanavalin A-like lectin/glucanases superfamily